MFESEFLELMPHIISVRHVGAYTVYGVPDPNGYSVAKHYYCRITGKKLSLRRRDGEEDTVIYDVWARPWPIGAKPTELSTFTVHDKVILPDDGTFDSVIGSRVDPIIFATERVSDEDGYHHIKLQFGWMYHRQGQ